MKLKNAIILAVLSAALCCQTGCATLIAMQIKNKLPKVEADSLSVVVNVAGLGGGSAETKGQHYDDKGNLVLGELHEIISTPTGSVKIDGTNVKLPLN